MPNKKSNFDIPRCKFILNFDVDDINSFVYCVVAGLFDLKCVDKEKIAPHFANVQFPKKSFEEYGAKSKRYDRYEDSSSEEEEDSPFFDKTKMDLQRGNFGKQQIGIEPYNMAFVDLNSKKHNFHINILSYINNDVYPLVTGLGYREEEIVEEKSNIKNLKIIQLLCVEDRYYLIDNMNGFLRMYYSSKSSKKITHMNRYFCPKCLIYFHKRDGLKNHLDVGCSPQGYQKVKMPKFKAKSVPPVMRFKNHHKKFPIKHSIIFDLEAALLPINEKDSSSKDPDPAIFTKDACSTCIKEGHLLGFRCRCASERSTRKVDEHRCMSYAFVIVNSAKEIVYEEADFSENGNAAEKMIAKWFELEKTLLKELNKETVPIIMTKANYQDFNTATHCCICDEEFNKKFDVRSPGKPVEKPFRRIVRHHNHSKH